MLVLADVRLQTERLERRYKALVRTVGADIPALVALGVPDVVAAGRQADRRCGAGDGPVRRLPGERRLALPVGATVRLGWAGVNGALPPPHPGTSSLSRVYPRRKQKRSESKSCE